MLCCWLYKLTQMFINAIKPERTITTSSNWTNTREQQQQQQQQMARSFNACRWCYWCYYVEIISGRIATSMKLVKETQKRSSTQKGERKRVERKRQPKRKIRKEKFFGKEKQGKIDKTPTLWKSFTANGKRKRNSTKYYLIFLSLSFFLSCFLSFLLAGTTKKENERKAKESEGYL